VAVKTLVDNQGDKNYHFDASLLMCNGIEELLAPLISKQAYANQVLVFVIFPLSNIGNSSLPIFPVGLVPLTSYNNSLLQNWLLLAQQQLKHIGLNTIFHAGDNNSAHRSHFMAELQASPVFPLKELRFGLQGIQLLKSKPLCANTKLRGQTSSTARLSPFTSKVDISIAKSISLHDDWQPSSTTNFILTCSRIFCIFNFISLPVR